MRPQLRGESLFAVVPASQSEGRFDMCSQFHKTELADLRKQDAAVRLLDVRSREEFEAVNIAGSQLMSQDVMRQIMGDGSNTRPLVIVDHQGKTALDAAAYFMGHGLQNVRVLRGGIDAWAQEVETTMRRYKLG